MPEEGRSHFRSEYCKCGKQHEMTMQRQLVWHLRMLWPDSGGSQSRRVTCGACLTCRPSTAWQRCCQLPQCAATEAALPSRGAAQIKELLSYIAIVDKGTLSRWQLLVDIMFCRYRLRGEIMGPFIISWIILFPKCAEPVEIHIQN